MSFWVILGAGMSGVSVAKYCHRRHIDFYIMDSVDNPARRALLTEFCPDDHIILGGYDPQLIAAAEQCVFSPGVDPRNNIFDCAKIKTNDIEIFASQARAPIIAVTGTNGKSTVVSLLDYLLNAINVKCLLGGNIGIPALDLLEEPQPDYYVLELSSFQLELVDNLKAHCAVVLNRAPDHLDRHESFEAYCAIKNKIYHGCDVAISDGQWPQTTIEFVDGEPSAHQYGLRSNNKDIILMKGDSSMLALSELTLLGRHNALNALVVIALCDSIKLPLSAYKQAMCEFTGLPHRCCPIRELEGVQWINDSKATNVAACLTAIESVSQTIDGKIILILGGRTKGESYRPLLPAIVDCVSHVLLIGESQVDFSVWLSGQCKLSLCEDMQAAVNAAKKLATIGDAVLLSPACASFDMFVNYQDRGMCFSQLVMEL